MPEFRLILLLCHVKLLKASNLFFKLDDETNLSAYAEITHAKEANSFQERESIKLLFVPAKRCQIFQLNRRDLHDVANVEREDPFGLVEKAKNVAHIRSLRLFAVAAVGSSFLQPCLDSLNLPVHFMK